MSTVWITSAGLVSESFTCYIYLLGSHMHQTFRQAVNKRFNTGESNANHYMTETMSLVVENRVPTGHLRCDITDQT